MALKLYSYFLTESLLEESCLRSFIQFHMDYYNYKIPLEKQNAFVSLLTLCISPLLHF